MDSCGNRDDDADCDGDDDGDYDYEGADGDDDGDDNENDRIGFCDRLLSGCICRFGVISRWMEI